MEFLNDFAISDPEYDSLDDEDIYVKEKNIDDKDTLVEENSLDDKDSFVESDSLVYSDSDSDLDSDINELCETINYIYTINNKKMKKYDYLEIIKNNILKYKPLNHHQLYYIKNMASKIDIDIIIDTFNDSIKHIESLLK